METQVQSYHAAKANAEKLWAKSRESADALQAFSRNFPAGPMGLTPDHVKTMPRYQVLKRASDVAFQELRAFNAGYVKTFKREISAERKTKYSGFTTA